MANMNKMTFLFITKNDVRNESINNDIYIIHMLHGQKTMMTYVTKFNEYE